MSPLQPTHRFRRVAASVLVLGCSAASPSSVHVEFDGDGTGKVTSGANALCTGSCQLPLTNGSLNLSALADEGSTFDGWTGSCSGSGACLVETAGAIVTAHFAKVPSPTDSCTPVTPEILSAVPSVRKATFRWGRGSGTCPVSRYHVQLSGRYGIVADGFVPASQTEVSEDSLAPNDVVCLKVAALTGHKEGPWSSEGCAWIPSIPPTAINVTAVPEGGALRVRWTDRAPSYYVGTPKAPGSEATSYEITTNPSTRTVNVAAPAWDALLPGLDPATTYEILVTPRNATGPALPPTRSGASSLGDRWRSAGLETDPRSRHSAWLFGDSILLLGGDSEQWGAPATNLRIRIGPDGQLGSRQTLSRPPFRNFDSTAAWRNPAGGGLVYSTGGVDRTGNTALVYWAEVSNEGELGPWQSGAPLIKPTRDHASCVLGHFLYLIGGYKGNDGLFTSAEVAVGELDAQGRILAWKATTSLPASRIAPTCATHDGHLYVMGGFVGWPVLPPVLMATPDRDGMIAEWQATSAQPSGIDTPAVVFSGYKVLLMGGTARPLDPDVTNRSPLLVGAFAASGDITSWTTNATDSLPGYRDAGAAVVVGGHLYYFGGAGEEAVSMRDALVTDLAPDGTLAAGTRRRTRTRNAKPLQQFATRP